MSWECDLEDGPKVYSWTEPVARKDHKCCECHALIRNGQKYFKAKGCWDGVWSTFRQHLLCMDACMYARDKLNTGECIGFGTLFEYYKDCKDWLTRTKKDEKVRIFRTMLAIILKRRREE